MNRSLLITLFIAALPVAAVAVDSLGTPVPVVLDGRELSAGPPCRLNGGELALPSESLSRAFGFAVAHSSGTSTWSLSLYDHTMVFRHGNREFLLDQKPQKGSRAALVDDGSLYIPVSVLARVYGYHVTPPEVADGPYTVTGATSRLVDVRKGDYPDKVRIVFDLEAASPFSVTEEDGKVVLELPTAPGEDARPGQLRLLCFEGDICSQVTTLITPDAHTRIIVPREGSIGTSVSTLGDPPRIIVDLLRPGSAVPPVVPTPATVTPVIPHPPSAEGPAIIPPDFDLGPWRVGQFDSPRGKVQAYYMVLDTRRQDVRLRPALAGQTVMTRATVASIARREGATAAINGTYFDWSGPPLGLLVINGEWIKPPIRNRSVLGFMRDGSVRIGNLEFDGKVYFQGLGYLPVCGLNQGHYEPDGVVVYTRRWGDYMPADPSKTYIVVNSDNEVQYVEWRGGAQNIPPGGYVISGTGARRFTLQRVKPGMKVSLSFRTAPEWPDLLHAIGAGPRLVKNGWIHVAVEAEQFDMDAYTTAKSQSAAGIMRDGKLLLFVCEKGLTMYELAHVMQGLGAVEAMKLDGGGSATAVVGRTVINHPTDGCPRAVSNALLVMVASDAGRSAVRAGTAPTTRPTPRVSVKAPPIGRDNFPPPLVGQ